MITLGFISQIIEFGQYQELLSQIYLASHMSRDRLYAACRARSISVLLTHHPPWPRRTLRAIGSFLNLGKKIFPIAIIITTKTSFRFSGCTDAKSLSVSPVTLTFLILCTGRKSWFCSRLSYFCSVLSLWSMLEMPVSCNHNISIRLIHKGSRSARFIGRKLFLCRWYWVQLWYHSILLWTSGWLKGRFCNSLNWRLCFKN